MIELNEYLDYDFDDNIENDAIENADFDDSNQSTSICDLEFIVSSLENERASVEYTASDIQNNVNRKERNVAIDDDEVSSSDDDEDSDCYFDEYKSLTNTDIWLSEDEIAVDNEISGPAKTKNEIIDQIKIPDEVYLNPTKEIMLYIGNIVSKIDSENTILVQSIETNQPLNEGSVLLLSNGLVIGFIQEVFGPLTAPFYVLKWHQNREVVLSSIYEVDDLFYGISTELTSDPVIALSTIVKKCMDIGTKFYSIDRLNIYVTPTTLRVQPKGSDASNFYDEEVVLRTSVLIFLQIVLKTNYFY